MLAKEYIPGSGPVVEKHKVKIPAVRYVVGIRMRGEDESGVGVTHGPFIRLEHALETVPIDSNSQIYAMIHKQDILLYKWRHKRKAWFLINKEYHWLYHENSECIFISALPTDEQELDMALMDVQDMGVVEDFDQQEIDHIYTVIFGEDGVDE